MPRSQEKASYHVEGVGRESERMHEEAAGEFEKEEKGVDDNHNLDAQALRPADSEEARHGGGIE
jgi:hypothetical protein